jgi:DNA-binding MarR family transcriptional regulator
LPVSDRKFAHRTPNASASQARNGNSGGSDRFDLGDLNDRLGYFVRRLQVWVFQDFIRTLASLDLRPAQYSVLVVIDANPGLSQADISGLLGIERARIVRLLDKLEKRGLIKREPSPNDRRSHALHLTRDGQKILRRANLLSAEHESRVTDKLGPGKRKLMIDVLREFGR